MKMNQLKLGTVLSYVQMAIGIAIGLAYTPVMIRILGQSEYGLYNTVSSAIAMMSTLSLGFSSGYIRFYSKYKVQNDDSAIYKLNGLLLTIYLVIAAIVVACGIYLSNHLDIVFDNGLTSSEYDIAKVLMRLLTVNLAMSFPMSVFTSIISAHEKYVFMKLVRIGKTVVEPMIVLPLLLAGFRSIAMVGVTIAVSTIVDIAYLIYVMIVLKQRFIICRAEKSLFLELFSYTFFIALNMIIDQINGNVGKVLLGRYVGTEAVAVYSVGYSLYQYYVLFSTSVSSVFTPRVHRIINETRENLHKQRQVVTELFVKVGRIQFLILALIASGLFFFGKPFIVNVWAGESYGDSYVVMILLVFSASIALIQNLGIEVQRALNKHQFRSIAYAVMAVVNLCMTVVLSQKYSAIGAAMGTALSLLIVNGLVMNIYYNKYCSIDIICFWKSIGQLSRGLIFPIVVGVILNKLLDLTNIFVFVASIFLYAISYIFSMWLVGMNDYEKSVIKIAFRKVIGNKK